MEAPTPTGDTRRYFAPCSPEIQHVRKTSTGRKRGTHMNPAASHNSLLNSSVLRAPPEERTPHSILDTVTTFPDPLSFPVFEKGKALERVTHSSNYIYQARPGLPEAIQPREVRWKPGLRSQVVGQTYKISLFWRYLQKEV